MYNQVYNIINEFIKVLEQDKNYSFLLKNWNGKRGSKRRLSVTQVIALFMQIMLVQTPATIEAIIVVMIDIHGTPPIYYQIFWGGNEYIITYKFWKIYNFSKGFLLP